MSFSSVAAIAALKLRYESQIAEAKVNLSIYMGNPVGIGEHKAVLHEIDAFAREINYAEGMLETLKNIGY